MGRSIPDSRLEDINQELEGDIMVRQVFHPFLQFLQFLHWFLLFDIFSYCFLFLLIFFSLIYSFIHSIIHSSGLLTNNFSFLDKLKKVYPAI